MDCEYCTGENRDPKPGVYRDNFAVYLCDDCDQAWNEAAYERSLSDYYGGSGPQSIRERMDDAYQVKRAAKA
jgi:hypothetical protein